MYVLLYVDQNSQPCYIQGSMDEINKAMRTVWVNGDIDHDDWEYSQNWELLGIEDGQLTPMEGASCSVVPHFEV